MAALRLPIEGTDHLQFVPAAGVPWFVALFGRDSLIVSLQNALVYPDFARGALDVLGSWQATERDDYRDAEPGKIMHELRLGELAHFKLVPHTPYYGTADATMLYLIVLHAAWRSCGDKSLLERHLQTAEECLEWIDKYGDRDGDGFQEYATRSSAGYENQGWKDAGDAVVNADGSLVKGPKALCELQGYVYDAWLRMAEIFDEIGKSRYAQALRAKAGALFNSFNETFWDEDIRLLRLCAGWRKKKVLTVASNPGHCLWSGIVPTDRAGRVVGRLMAPDMWSGWGIRTLSADHPAYNPYSYQNGSVWPHDNGFIALGFRRYGLPRRLRASPATSAAREAILCNIKCRNFTPGSSVAPRIFPSNISAPTCPGLGGRFGLRFLQAILGFQPDAPMSKLYIDPVLPEWLPDITVVDLRVGQQNFDVQFWRDGDKTRWKVLKGDRSAVIETQCASGSNLCTHDDAVSNRDVDEELRYHSLLDIDRRMHVRFVPIAGIPGGSTELHSCSCEGRKLDRIENGEVRRMTNTHPRHSRTIPSRRASARRTTVFS